MKGPDSSSPQRVDDERAARVLTDIDQVRMLLPFMGQERSVAEVARALGLAIDAMSYRVRRFAELGLVEQTREQPRKGRAIRFYRAASTMFVPLQVVPDRTTEELLEQADEHMRRQVAASMTRSLYRDAPFRDWGVLVRRHASGEAELTLAPAQEGWGFERLLDPAAPALLSSWMPLALDFEEAKALQAELYQLIGKYAGREGAQRYLLGLALAPVE